MTTSDTDISNAITTITNSLTSANTALATLTAGVKQVESDRDNYKAQLAVIQGGGTGTTTGAKLYFHETFQGGKLTVPFLQVSWRDANYAPNTSQSKFVQNSDGSWSIAYYALAGTNEAEPFILTVPAENMAAMTGKTDISQVALQWQEYFEPSFPFPTSSQKLMRMGFNDSRFPADQKSLSFVTQNSNVNMQVECEQGQWGDSTYGKVDIGDNTGLGVPTGQWTTFKLYVKLNTPSKTDGSVWLYKNGSALIKTDNVNLRGSDPKGYSYIEWGMNSSQLPGSGGLPRSGLRLIRDINAWDSWPG